MLLLYMDINELYIKTIHVNNLVVSYIFGLYLYYIFTLLYLLCVFNGGGGGGGGGLMPEITRFCNGEHILRI